MKSRLTLLSLLLALVVVPLTVAFVPWRQGQPTLQLTVSAGYGGYYRRGLWTPVRVNISNSGDALSGVIRVRTGGIGGADDTTYQTPLDLPEGARKQLFLYVSLGNYAQDIQVEVVDSRGKVVISQVAGLRMANSEDILGAVVTTSPLGAVDLTARLPGSGSAHQVLWRIEDIPAKSEALASLDLIMFHDVDTGMLQEDQMTAISRWVLTGGHLIVAGGDSWQRTTAGLADLLPVELRGTVPLETLTPLALYLKRPSGGLGEGTTAVSTLPHAGAQILVSVGDVPLVVRGAYGAGFVDFLAVDPGAEPLRSWADKSWLWYTLARSVGQQPPWVHGISDWASARDATRTMYNTVLPTLIQLCGFLAIYIMLIGPVNYLVLKRLNRREWAWFSILALIVVFSALAYAFGFNLRGTVPTVSRLNIVQVWPGTAEAQVETLIGVQSPRRRSYDVSIERGYLLRALPEEGIGLDVPAVFDEGTRYVAQNIAIDGGMIASFTGSGAELAPSLESSATWMLSGDQVPRVVGEIRNTTDISLQDAVILVKGEARALGTLAPGETATYDIALGPQDPAPLTLGNMLQRFATYTYNPFGYGSSVPGWCFSHRGITLTISDVMQGEPFSCKTTGITRHEQEIRRRYQMLAALITDYDVSGGRDSGVYVFAWAGNSLVDVALSGQAQREEDTTLYIFALPVRVSAVSSTIEIPAGLTTWSVVETADPRTMLDVKPASFEIASGSQAAFQFMPMRQMTLSDVEQLVVKFSKQGPLALDLWDWESESWVTINLSQTSASTEVNRPARFIGPENAVNVRIYSQDDSAYNRVEFVEVAYRGQLADR